MALALDGVGTTNTNAGTVTLTTTLPGTIVVIVANEGVDNANPCPTVSSVTASGLTFTRRGGKNLLNYASNFGIAVPENVEIWWAPSAASVTSKVITVAWSGTLDDACLLAFGVSGSYDATSPWDTNVSLPGFNSTSNTTTVPTKPTYSTTAADTFIFAISEGLTTVTPTSAWTTIATIANTGGGRNCELGVFYQIVSAAQTSQQPSLTQTSAAAIFGVDALKLAGGAGAATWTPKIIGPF